MRGACRLGSTDGVLLPLTASVLMSTSPHAAQPWTSLRGLPLDMENEFHA